MATIYAEPTIDELIKAFGDGVRSSHDRHADTRSGSVLDQFAGVAAIIWQRQARRDTDLWRAIYFATAEGRDLTRLLEARTGFLRRDDTFGVGTVDLQRPTADAADGTIWRGTRIAVFGPAVDPRTVVVTEDTPVAADSLRVAVPIRADRTGPGTAFTTIGSPLLMRIDDPLWDATWRPVAVRCGDGTSFQPAPDARAAVLTQRRAARPGFVDSIAAACRDVGATTAVCFASDYAGEDSDCGLNYVYVGDQGGRGDDALVRRVKVALERTRVLGDCLQVLPLAVEDLEIRVNAFLWDNPGRVNQPETRRVLEGAILGYFEGVGSGYSYTRDAIGGAMLRASAALQQTTFETPLVDASVLTMVGGRPNFPAVLTRFRVRRDTITIDLRPPA